MKINENELVASICRESFLDFINEFWGEAIPGIKFHYNWHIGVLADNLQEAAERVFLNQPKKYDLAINVPPGTSKSTICSVLFPCWTWTRMKTARHLTATHADKLVKILSNQSRNVLNSSKFRAVFPDVRIDTTQINTADLFYLVGGGWRSACTVGGKSPVGQHAHFVEIDDPIDPKQARSQAGLDEAARFMTEVIPSRVFDLAVAVFILIMQRLDEQDPTSVMVKQEKIRHIVMGAEVDDLVQPETLKRFYVDGLLDPKRLPREELKAQFLRLGDYAYAGQYRQMPTPPEGHMFKVGKLKTNVVMPTKWKKRIRFWDKAATDNAGAYTAGVLLGEDDQGRFWVIDVRREQMDSAEREAFMKSTAREDGFDVTIGLEQEPGSGGVDSANYTRRNLAGFRVHVVKVGASDGDKARRADPFSAQVNSGNVYLGPGDWHDAYINEMKHFPNSRFKDQIDASSSGFNFMTWTVVIGAF